MLQRANYLVHEATRHGILGITMPDTDEYLTAAQAAQILRVTDRQARNYAALSQVRSKRVGNRVLLHRGDVEALAVQMRASEKPPTGPEMFTLLEKLRGELQAALAREAALEERLRTLPSLEEVTRLREELAVTRAERDQLRVDLERYRSS